MEKEFDIIVEKGCPRERLDIFLSKRTGITRSQIDKLIKEGFVRINNQTAKQGYRVKTDDRIYLSVPQERKMSAEPQEISLDVVYEDDDIIVINKPPGIVVHPSAGHADGTMVNALLFHCRDLSGIGGKLRPGVVHRLDRDTSGLIIFAKNNESHLSLARQIKARQIKKIYTAIVHGKVARDMGVINAPLGRNPKDRKKIAVIRSEKLKKREAETHYKVLRRFRGYTLLQLDLKTGRTHQIRVHLAHIGHPIVGDTTYSRKKSEMGVLRQMLHASRLELNHPITGKHMVFESDIPGDMKGALDYLIKDVSGDNAE